MLFSHIASFFFFGLATTAIASPAPAPVALPIDLALRQVSESSVETVFESLNSTVTPILAQITDLTSSNTVTEDNITPLLNQLTDAINGATSSLAALPTSTKRQSGDELADLVAGIIEAVVETLDALVGDLAKIPALSGLLSGIDAALAKLLSGLEALVADVLELVAQLLVNVAGLLSALAFDLTLASLGL